MNSKGSSPRTARFLRRVAVNEPEAVKQFLENGGDLHNNREMDTSPLWYAFYNKCPLSITALLDAGAGPPHAPWYTDFG